MTRARLSPELAALLAQARAARRHSYSPYSRFKVGAAVELTDGAVYLGTNVENASYGLAICAERAAIFAAVGAHGPRIRIRALALSCQGAERRSAPPAAELMPCGACRQVMAEFATRATRVVVDGVGELRMEELLPHAFALRAK